MRRRLRSQTISVEAPALRAVRSAAVHVQLSLTYHLHQCRIGGAGFDGRQSQGRFHVAQSDAGGITFRKSHDDFGADFVYRAVDGGERFFR